MSNVENGMVIGAQDELERRQTKTDKYWWRNYETLRSQYLNALLDDPGRVIWTPGFGESDWTAQRVLDDQACGDESILTNLITIMARVHRGEFESAKLLADLLLDTVTSQHAKFHADDAMMEDEE